MTAVVLKSNEFWGKRSGTRSEERPKNMNTPWGCFFRQSQWGAGANNQKGGGKAQRRRERRLLGGPGR